ncbi:MAG: ornithine carbamoyltransferase [Ardenticatenales bacterium]|nr:ornithine carbamoyltransferase [Ardenticatenales bacterium]
MAPNHFLTLSDLDPAIQTELIMQSVRYGADYSADATILAGKVVGSYFSKPSTRTRSAFSVGALRLGSQLVTYGPQDLQLTTGETLEDTARVLAGYLDALVVRSNGPIEKMHTLTKQNRMPIINAMSENEHPTQALTDLSTMQEHFGALQDLHVLYLGEGNNTAAALALAVANTPQMKITFVTPPDYGLPESLLAQAQSRADKHKACIVHHHDISKLPQPVDVVYATRWETMGVFHTDSNWKDRFWPYSVTETLMDHVSRTNHTVFMHDLPAVRGDDVSSAVLDGPQSIAWRQAEYKMFSAMALLKWLMV